MSGEIFSVTWDIPLSAGGDWWGLLNDGSVGGPHNPNQHGRAPGAGLYPAVPVNIIGYDLAIWASNPPGYVMIGHTQPNGDAITPYVYASPGRAERAAGFYPAGSYFRHDPAADELHMHAACYGVETGLVHYTMFYQLP